MANVKSSGTWDIPFISMSIRPEMYTTLLKELAENVGY